MNKAPENKELAARLNKWAIGLSTVVLLTVGLMRRVKFETSIDFSFLPAFNALCNTIVAACLILAFYFIKNKQIEQHRKAIYGALFFSALFLVSYVLYHFTTEETLFCKEGTIRTVYFTLLISHIVLAGLSLPFILFTFIRGFTRQDEAHRRLAKYVFPVWLYVAVSGPLCYLMLKPCY